MQQQKLCTLEERRQHVASWRASGLTRQQYCEFLPPCHIEIRHGYVRLTADSCCLPACKARSKLSLRFHAHKTVPK